jgi:hypothetical protein
MNKIRATAIVVLVSIVSFGFIFEQRSTVSYLRGPYNIEFYKRHNQAFRVGAAIHFAHGKQHDVLLLTPVQKNASVDEETDGDYLKHIANPPRTEPTMELYGPYTAQTMFQLYRAIDWTHMHHEQTYDILSDRSISWDKKKKWTDRAVRYYLNKLDIPRSPAPLDVTMRRAAVMMKPYFGAFRNKYPQSNNFFYAAHWWHPVIYEAMMLAGNDEEQDLMVKQTDETFFKQVLNKRPQRMLLSREMMPRYSRMSPESANIFDNLHMLHGIAYDILAYEGWTLAEKKKELYRVIQAMSYQPGDEKLARKFSIPHPDTDPRNYESWMQGADGEMNRIMKEMLEEMMPMMMPEATTEQKNQVMEQFKLHATPGMQAGEMPGSFMESVHKIVPDAKMSQKSMKPGEVSQHMVQMMMDGWINKHGNKPDVEALDMTEEPSLDQWERA